MATTENRRSCYSAELDSTIFFLKHGGKIELSNDIDTIPDDNSTTVTRYVHNLNTNENIGYIGEREIRWINE